MTLYLDTSLLVSILTTEADGERVETWLRLRAGEELLVSDWVVAEFSAALSRKLRIGELDEHRRGAALGEFSRLCTGSMSILPVEREQFRQAARFSDRHAPGLRAGDALHLAIAFDSGATLCTLDQRLGAAGPPLGVATLLV